MMRNTHHTLQTIIACLVIFSSFCPSSRLWAAGVHGAMSINSIPVAPTESKDPAIRLAGLWESFPLVDGPGTKPAVAREVPVLKPDRDGSINSDGWRRLLLNLSPVLIDGKRFDGFRFRYDGQNSQDLVFIYKTRPMGQGDRQWGIINSKGQPLSLGYYLEHPSLGGLVMQNTLGNEMVPGQEYLLWFSLEYDYPVELDFRLAYSQIHPDITKDFAKLSDAMAQAAGLDLHMPAANPYSHIGIGITGVKQAGKHPGIIVTGVAPGSPAAEKGVTTMLLILAINKRSTADMTMAEFDDIIRQKPLAPVMLTFVIRWQKDVIINTVDILFEKAFIDGEAYQKLLGRSLHLCYQAMTGDSTAVLPAARALVKEGNMKRAMEWFMRAADQGNREAVVELAKIYDAERGYTDPVLATQYFEQAAQMGDVESAFECGRRHELAIGTDLNYQRAAEYYLQAAKLGDMNASLKIAHWYEIGRGVPQDEMLASRWFETAAFQGYSEGAFKLGMLHLSHQEYTEAMKWFMRSLAGSQPQYQACIEIGKMHEAGLGVPKNETLAAQWYINAGQQNEARYRYALLLRKQTNTNSQRIARIRLLMAAREGYEPAQRVLAGDGLDWRTLKLPSEEPPAQ